MTEIATTTEIRIYSDEEWSYTVSDNNIAVGTDGCTISYWEKDERKNYITMEAAEAIAIADAIYKLFKQDGGTAR